MGTIVRTLHFTAVPHSRGTQPRHCQGPQMRKPSFLSSSSRKMQFWLRNSHSSFQIQRVKGFFFFLIFISPGFKRTDKPIPGKWIPFWDGVKCSICGVFSGPFLFTSLPEEDYLSSCLSVHRETLKDQNEGSRSADSHSDLLMAN